MAAGQILTAGNAESNDIAIEHPTVSPRHIELQVNDDGSFDVFDLGAAAGTFVYHKEKWTRFGHATVARDERLRLGGYETTAGALVEMAGDGAGGEPGGPVEGDSDPPSEDVHEVTTHRSREHRRSAGEERAGEAEQTMRRNGTHTSEKGPQTVKLPAHHANAEAASGPTPRPARDRAKPQTVKLPARHTGAAAESGQTPRPARDRTKRQTGKPPARHAAKAAPDIVAPREASKSLVATYLLWLFLGGLGAHRFYLGSIGIGIAQAALLVVGVVPVVVFGGGLFDNLIPTIVALLGVAVLTCLAVWLIIDAFLIPGLVHGRHGKPGASR